MAAKIRRLDSMAPHKSAMDKYFEDGLTAAPEMLKRLDIGNLMKDLMADPSKMEDPAAMAEFAKSVQEKAAKVSNEFQHDNIEALWDEYDKDKNEDMTLPEVEQLMTDSLSLTSKNIEVVMTKQIDLMLENIVVPMKLGVTAMVKKENPQMNDTDISAQVSAMLPDDETLKASIKTQLDAAMPTLLEAVRKSMVEVEADKENLAKAMIEEMDKNHDGKVSKKEFMEHFTLAMAHIVDIGKLIEKGQVM